MKKLYLLLAPRKGISIAYLLTLLCGLNLLSQPLSQNEVRQNFEFDFFTGTWDQIVELAQFSKKPIALFLYKSYGNDYRHIRKLLFYNQELAELMQENFVNAAVIVDTPLGKKLFSKHEEQIEKASRLPGFLIYDVHTQINGYIPMPTDAEQLEELALYKLNQSRSNYVPVNREVIDYMDNKLRFENGVRNSDFLYDFAYQMRKFHDDPTHVIQLYLSSEGYLKNPTSEKNLRFIYFFAESIHSVTFPQFLEHLALYAKPDKHDFLKDKLNDILLKSIYEAVINKNPNALQEILDIIPNMRFINPQDAKFRVKTKYYELKGSLNNIIRESDDYLAKYLPIGPNAQLLDNIAWTIAKMASTPKELKYALNLSEQVLELTGKHFENFETNAVIHYLLGDKKKALKKVDKAIEVGRLHGEVYTSSLKLKDIIKNGGNYSGKFSINEA